VTAKSTAEERIPFDRLTGLRFARALRNFLFSEVRWKAASFFALLIVFLFAINGLNVVNSYVARDFMTAIAERNRTEFVWQALVYVGVFVASTLVAVLYRFSEERLALLWRNWLTGRLLQLYLGDRAYQHLEAYSQVANPDQRIADDTRAFTATTLSFLLLFLNASFTVVAFAGVLWSISTSLFLVAVGYALLGSLMTILLGRPLVWLNYNQLDKEANLRSDLIHVRQHTESIALTQREGALLERLQRQLEALTSNWQRIIGVNRNLSFFTTGYNYLIQIIPALIIAPLFIRGEVEFGVITQSAMAFSQLLGAFSLIITQFQSISSFTAVVARLASLADALEQAQSSPSRIEAVEDNQRVAYDRVTLASSADGRPLVSALSVSIPRGLRVLIRAENQAAGIALLRATAGTWGRGEGRIIRPDFAHIYFVPERPYLPIGTLREGLRHSGRAATDGEIRSALEALQIQDLLDRFGSLDVEKDWNAMISLGEQQLLVVARVLLAAPAFVVLDRIAAALDAAQSALVLNVLADRGITYIAFAGNGEDKHLYDAFLDIAADGAWSWHEGRPS
jgi:putative ATP-binding cassette transporter